MPSSSHWNSRYSCRQCRRIATLALTRSIPLPRPSPQTKHATTPLPTVVRITDLLTAFARARSLRQGKAVHCHILRFGAHLDEPCVHEQLTRFYASCGRMGTARLLFDEMPTPPIFLWNSMIRAYAWNGPLGEALELYRRMRSSGVAPNKFTFPFVLKACSGLRDLEGGVEVHRAAENVGLDGDVFVSTALIDMYMKCGRLDEARRVFDEMPLRDVVAWNAMVAGFSLHGMYEEVIGYVLGMQRSGLSPTPSTLVALLPVIGQEKALNQGKSVHGFCLRRGWEENDILVGTAILDSYGKCELLDYAQKVFDSMAVMNEVTWSSMMGAYVSCNGMVEAVVMFRKMSREGTWNLASSIIATVLRAFAILADLNGGRSLHACLMKCGYESDVTVGNTLLSMYGKCGSIDDTLALFREMPVRDAVCYSAVISTCVQNGDAKEALLFFQEMQWSDLLADKGTMAGVVPACAHLAALQLGKCSHGYIVVLGLFSDVSLCNALIDMYAKCGKIDYARNVFDAMRKRDIVSWNSMIMGYGIHGLGRESVSLFSDLLSTNLKPDDVTFICLLSACSHSGLVSEGKRWFHVMSDTFHIEPRMEHFVCMVDLFGRAGLLDEAQDFIHRMPLKPDIHIWGALLGACRVHKNMALAEVVIEEIRNLGMDNTGNFVLLSNIYSAAGKFEEAAIVRIIQKNRGLSKIPGCSWIEVKGKVHAFIGGDQSHSDYSKIYEKLKHLLLDIKKLGYCADTSFVLQNVEEEEKEHAILHHSEKLAIAFGIISLGTNQHIFVTKNLRICGDCHSFIKYITMATKRTISVRDASRFHHFNHGRCNCGDFW